MRLFSVLRNASQSMQGISSRVSHASITQHSGAVGLFTENSRILLSPPEQCHELTSASMALNVTSSKKTLNSKPEVLAEQISGMCVATLNRPEALNALNLKMVVRLKELYEEWEQNKFVHTVLIKGEGRAFCAGGDVRAIHQSGAAVDAEIGKEFFRREYELNYVVATLKKTHVAFLDGHVMGGGNGVSMHGPFRVATENTSFAMPETAIGLHPDVGASYFLGRLPGHLGEYLGLTGTRLDAAEMLALGLATHFVPSENLGLLQQRLSYLQTGNHEAVHLAISEHGEHVTKPSDDSPIRKQSQIDECFKLDGVEDIMAALAVAAKHGEKWALAAAAAMKKASPTSLKVTLRSIREGRNMSLADCLKREYRLSVRCVEASTSRDFYEGVRALLVDKDNLPKWKPATLEGVTSSMVAQHFSPLNSPEEELKLPILEREPKMSSRRSML